MSEQLNRLEPLLHSIERHLENFKKIGRNKLTASKVRTRITALRDLWKQIQEGHAALLDATDPASRATLDYFKDNKFYVAEELYLSTLDHLVETLEEFEPPASPQNDSFNSNHNRSTAALSLSQFPAIKLPSFDGDLNNWEQFRDQFQTLVIQSPDMKDFARMHYLTSSLKGQALNYIRRLPITAASFPIGWRLLRSRYENKSRMVHLHFTKLLSLPILSRESANDLQSLLDDVNIAIASLNNLDRTPAELWNDILVHIASQRFDPETRKAWRLEIANRDAPPSFETLEQFVANRVEALEDPLLTGNAKTTKKPGFISKLSVATASASPLPQCPVCDGRHYLSVCPNFVKRTPSQRRELVKEHHRCFNCLSHKHSASECKSKYACRTCHQRHHTMLHTSSGLNSASVDPIAITSKTSAKPVEVQALFASSAVGSQSQTLLATALISVRGDDGRSIIARALLDQGSEISFISENLAQSLRLKRRKMPTSVSAVGGVHAGTFRFAASIIISPRDSRSRLLCGPTR